MSGENKNHDDTVTDTSCDGKADINRRAVLLGSSSLVAAATLTSQALAQAQKAAPAAAPATPAAGRKPNILVIFGDDIGIPQISAYTMGMMGYRTPNIDRIAGKAPSSPTPTASKAAPPAAPPSSSARSRSAPAFSPSACPAIRTASRTGCRPLPT